MAALAEYSDLGTTVGLVSYFGVGLATGFAVNTFAPQPTQQDSTAALLLQIGAQSTAGFLLLTQVMRMVLPSRDNWLPPCSDASAVVGMLLAQPRARQALDIVLARLDDAARQQLGIDVLMAGPAPSAAAGSDQATAQE